MDPIIENSIAKLLKEKIRTKLSHYSPETQSMPFHVRLLGKDRMAIYSFVHSVNTMLGQSIFEKVAEFIGKKRFDIAESQYSLKGHISEGSVLAIDRIMSSLKDTTAKADEQKEDEIVRLAANNGNLGNLRKSKVDVFLARDNTEYFCEIKTAKPNIDVFVATKIKMLNWKAMRYSERKDKLLKSFICIPYNPEAPAPYSRWTLQGMYDISNEVLVAEEFWDFVGGKGTYEEILDIFEKVGIELREEIDKKFAEFK